MQGRKPDPVLTHDPLLVKSRHLALRLPCLHDFSVCFGLLRMSTSSPRMLFWRISSAHVSQSAPQILLLLSTNCVESPFAGPSITQICDDDDDDDD